MHLVFERTVDLPVSARRHKLNSRSGEERAQEKREQHPILDNDIGWQRKEIEANVLVVERVVRAIGHLIEEPQEDAPIADLSPGDKHSEEAAAGDDEWPRQPLAYEFQQVRLRTRKSAVSPSRITPIAPTMPVMISANTAPRHSSRRLGPVIPIVMV